MYIKGGTVRAVSGCAVLAQLTTHVNITGGEVSAQDGIAVFLTSWGGAAVDGTAKITSANSNKDNGTIVVNHIDESQTDVYLEIMGGTVENTAPNGNAIINRGFGKVEISGGVIDGSGNNETGVFIYNSGSMKTVIIKKGTPIIKGRGYAINGTPVLTEEVQVSAGNNYESDTLADSSLVLLFPANLHKKGSFSLYKYLRFKPTTAVAKAGIDYYFTLQEAFDNAEDGSVIYLLSDLTLGQTVFNEKGKSYTLDLNGKSLYCPSGSVLNNICGDLTITDSSKEQSGCINDDIKNGAGTLTIAGGKVLVSGNNAVAISSVARSGPIVITGGMVKVSGQGARAIDNGSVSNPVRISGNAVIISESGWAISSKLGVVIESAGPVIKGGGYVLNTGSAPVYNSDKIRVKASFNFDGASLTAFDESQFYKYKYLEFAPLGSVWLSGDGLKSDDPLIAEKLTGGDDYVAFVKLEEVNDVFNTADVIAVYKLSLKSGAKTTGKDIFVNFDVVADNAEQGFSMVVKKGDNTYEFFYATADATGEVTFGPIAELSAVMLVKGLLPEEQANPGDLDTQAGGVFQMYLWGINIFWFIGAGAVLIAGAAVMAVILIRKRKAARAE